MIRRTEKLNGRAVRMIRTISGLTQRQFADKVGLSLVFVARVEVGTRGLSDRSADRILRAFDMTVDQVRELETFAKEIRK